MLLKAVGNTYFTVCASAGAYLATTIPSLAADSLSDIDPSSPLDAVKKGQDAAKKSNMNMSQVQTGTNSLYNAAVIVVTLVGFILMCYCIYGGYRAVKEGDSSRERVGMNVIGGVIGLGLMISGVVAGAGTNWLLGNT